MLKTVGACVTERCHMLTSAPAPACTPALPPPLQLTGLGGRIDEDEKKIAILQSIAIVSLIFAMAALCLGIFAACK